MDVGEKRMYKVNLYCWLVALSIIIFGGFYIKYLNNALDNEKKSNKQLVLTLEKRNNDVVEISRKNKELEASAKKDTSGFDWSVNISDSHVIKQLQEQCVSCPK